MPRGRMKKEQFEDLDSDFKDTVAGMTEAEIRNKLAQVSLNQVELMKAKENDDDLKQKQEAVKEAGAIYREGTKMNKMRIEFCHRVLGDRGKDTGDANEQD